MELNERLDRMRLEFTENTQTRWEDDDRPSQSGSVTIHSLIGR
jgi:hypothetical protein